MKLMVNEDAKWPKEINLIEIQRIQKVHSVVDELKAQMISVDPTVENVSADPAHFIPALAIIIASIEAISDSNEDTSRTPRVFPLLPFPNLKWRYISVNDKTLPSNTGQLNASTYQGKVELFYNVFDFTKFGFER
jgi:hypothetical protein